MKTRILYMTLAMAGTLFSFQAAAQVNVENGSAVTELPGNTSIVTGNGGQNGVLIYNNDESLLYRTLVAPHVRPSYSPVQNSASLNDVQSMCGQITRASEKNRCIADVIKQQEKIRRRYNE